MSFIILVSEPCCPFFTGYKDSIKSWIKQFTVDELKESSRVEWDVDLSWGIYLKAAASSLG